MSKKLTILFVPLDYIGPINAAIGIAEVLRDRGHRIVFAVSENWRQKLNIYGFEEEIFDIPVEESETEEVEDPAQKMADFVEKAGLFGPISPLEKAKNYNRNFCIDVVVKGIKMDPIMRDIVDRIKPDAILIDAFLWMPSLMDCGIPWVWTISCNPLFRDYAVEDENIPPSASGFPINSDHKEWENFRKEKNETIRDACNQYNEWLNSKGYPSLPENKLVKASQYLNTYMFPKELDYTDVTQLDSTWHQFDCFKRSGVFDTFEIPEKLKNRSGKLIYLSMGSMGGADVQLMKKYVSILSKSEHRFIVSKGPLHDRYELADNMWGEKSLPQIKILPIIDLYITHGGNNSVTECCFFGKPMLVMPLFFDQYDNAQRVQEKGFGIRLDPYECSETQLLQSIDKVLNDEKISFNVKKMGERIRLENNILNFNKLIEDLVANNNN